MSSSMAKSYERELCTLVSCLPDRQLNSGRRKTQLRKWIRNESKARLNCDHIISLRCVRRWFVRSREKRSRQGQQLERERERRDIFYAVIDYCSRSSPLVESFPLFPRYSAVIEFSSNDSLCLPSRLAQHSLIRTADTPATTPLVQRLVSSMELFGVTSLSALLVSRISLLWTSFSSRFSTRDNCLEETFYSSNWVYQRTWRRDERGVHRMASSFLIRVRPSSCGIYRKNTRKRCTPSSIKVCPSP